MQPLTPAEHREIESLKNAILKFGSVTADFVTREEEIIEQYVGDRDLWLKVLTMALECNQVLEVEWRKQK